MELKGFFYSHELVAKAEVMLSEVSELHPASWSNTTDFGSWGNEVRER